MAVLPRIYSFLHSVIMNSRRHAHTHRDYHSPDNSLCVPKLSMLDQSSVTDSSRGLRAQLNEKEIELLHLHTKCFKWKQRCKTQEELIKELGEKLKRTEDTCKVVKEKYAAQVQATKAFEERRKGAEHFQIRDSSASVRFQQSQLQSLQAQIEALESAQSKILSENELLKRPKDETETALRVVLADLTSIHRDVTELNKVLKVFLNHSEYPVSTLIGTLFSRAAGNGQEGGLWTRLVNVVRAISREVEELRVGLAAFTENKKREKRQGV